MENNYKINLNLLTAEATKALMELDDTYVGTKNYMGLTYFWAYDYRYPMRDASVALRKKIHAKLLKAGLEVDKVSAAHQAIIMEATK